MDSWAEADWLQRLRHLAAGRTTLIVTHRFTTAMQAEVIHVMEQGRVVESGSHAELLELGGPYAQSWRAQMQAGQDSAVEPQNQPLPRMMSSDRDDILGLGEPEPLHQVSAAGG